MVKQTSLKTNDGLTVYDLEPQASDLRVVAGHAGYTGEIDPDALPEGFRWVTEYEWESLQSGRFVVDYEFTGVASLHACKAAIVAVRVMERLENTDLREVWREVVEELGDDWDKESLFAVLHNCSFSAE